MNKKILSCALVAAMLASSVGAMGVSALSDDAYKRYTAKQNVKLSTLDLNTVYTGTYEDALTDGMNGNLVYLFDYKVDASQSAVDYDDVVAAIEAAVKSGDTTANVDFDGDTDADYDAAIKALADYYMESGDDLTLDKDVNAYTSADIRKEALNRITTQAGTAKTLREDKAYYDTSADSDWMQLWTDTLISDTEGGATNPQNYTSSELFHVASEAETVFSELVMTTSWEDKYTEEYDEISSWDESDYTASNYRKLTRILEDAEEKAAAGTEKGYKEAYDILKGAYKVETETPDYADLKSALEGLYVNGKIPTTGGAYNGDDANSVYQESDYENSKKEPSDEWWEFAGNGKTGDNKIEGAYEKAWDIYNQCKYSSTRKYVGQSRVDAALEELNNALYALDPNYETSNWVVVMLEDALEVANNVVEDDFRTTSSYWKTFVKDKERIEKLLEQDVIKQKTAEDAVKALLGSDMDATKDTGSEAGSLAELSKCKLAVSTSIKTALKDAIREAKDLLEDKTGKTSSQIVTLQNALKDAEEITTKNTISEYENATTTLEDAMTNYEHPQGWYKDNNGTWFYGKEGDVAKGWLNVNGVWYLLDSETGAMKTGWQQVNGTWYYMNASGAMQTGWLNLNGTYYYLESWGGMATGWKSVNGSWYYLQPSSGAMVANGWYWINGKCYYFYNWGGMAANTTIDGYKVDASGAWVK